jgi:glyoxylase-like metal-dependent hydrolase (beta-lactamase superfamily II)
MEKLSIVPGTKQPTLQEVQARFETWRRGNREYLSSLDKVFDLDIDMVLPGHRSVFTNFKERIRELQQHHSKRAEEVLGILAAGPQSAFQVASQMSWDIVSESWDLFPIQQKWFATGEALAHLVFLESQRLVYRERVEGHLIEFHLVHR